VVFLQTEVFQIFITLLLDVLAIACLPILILSIFGVFKLKKKLVTRGT
jgi:hypothetical protein